MCKEDYNGCFQQDHFVQNMGAWYRVRTDKEDVDNQKNRRESVDANTRLEATRQQANSTQSDRLRSIATLNVTVHGSAVLLRLQQIKRA